MSGIISFLGSILYVLDEDRTASSITDGTEEFD